jgi:hypothetical protein
MLSGCAAFQYTRSDTWGTWKDRDLELSFNAITTEEALFDRSCRSLWFEAKDSNGIVVADKDFGQTCGDRNAFRDESSRRLVCYRDTEGRYCWICSENSDVALATFDRLTKSITGPSDPPPGWYATAVESKVRVEPVE